MSDQFSTPQCRPTDLFLSGMNKSERAKLISKPWGMADVMREKKAAEKRKEIVAKWRERNRKK